MAAPSANTKVNANNKLSANVTRSVVVTLREGERFDYRENCIDLGFSINQIEFVVKDKNGKCVSYKNGIRSAIPCPQRRLRHALAMQLFEAKKN